MNCCQCQGIEKTFNQKYVAKEVSQYRQKGPDGTTRVLLNQLQAEGVQGKTLLDIGGGVGVIPNELFKAGLARAVNVEASRAYLQAAEDEAARQGHADRASFYHGDFVELAPKIPPADIVTLDRVICCYHDMPGLVGLSAARAAKRYGLILPRETWWVKLGVAIANLFVRVTRNPYRAFVHPTKAVQAVVKSQGLDLYFHRKTFIWQVMVFARA